MGDKLASSVARELLASGVPAPEVARRTGLTRQGVHRAARRGPDVDAKASQQARLLLASGLEVSDVVRQTGLTRQGVRSAAQAVTRRGVSSGTARIRFIVELPAATRRALLRLRRLRGVTTTSAMVVQLLEQWPAGSQIKVPPVSRRGQRTQIVLPASVATRLASLMSATGASRAAVVRALVDAAMVA
jgi:hypothetical protein